MFMQRPECSHYESVIWEVFVALMYNEILPEELQQMLMKITIMKVANKLNCDFQHWTWLSRLFLSAAAKPVHKNRKVSIMTQWYHNAHK